MIENPQLEQHADDVPGAYLNPAGSRPVDRTADALARLARVWRGDGKWLCRGLPACGDHLKCLRDGSPAPRVVKEIPGVTDERGGPVYLHCYCHNCDQQNRRNTKRPRWTTSWTAIAPHGTRNGPEARLYFRVADLFDQSHDFLWDEALLCLGYVGSQSHGTYVPPTDPDAIDDIDLMGVLMPSRRHILGLDSFEHWTCQKDGLDVVAYSFHKFVGLLLKGNPNVLGLLWLREADYLRRSAGFLELQKHRHLFAAKSVYASFAGYASGQLQRMTSYSQAIEDEIQTLGRELEAAGWLTSEIMDGRSLPMPKGMTPAVANEKAARLKALRAKYHAAYMGEKRKRLVRQHGYDTKNASHLVRLLRMCVEFLGTGELQVYRENDAETLRAIKRGEWTLEAVKGHAEELFAAAKQAREASPLPDEVDRAAVNQLVADITAAHLELSA